MYVIITAQNVTMQDLLITLFDMFMKSKKAAMLVINS